MRQRISRRVLDAIHAAAEADAGREICGVLLGEGEAITGWAQAANVAEDPATRFEIDPAALFRLLRAERAGGPRVMGYVHSHPSGDVAPSVTDAAMAAPDGRLWMIVGRGRQALWRAGPSGERHGRFDPVDLDVTEAVAPA
jgi:proteasome lid subunit RPN8/RPN11